MKSIFAIAILISTNSFASSYLCQTLVNSEDPKQSGIAVVDDVRGLFTATTNDGQENEVLSADTVAPYSWRWLQWDRNKECKTVSQVINKVTEFSFSCNSPQEVSLSSVLEY